MFVYEVESDSIEVVDVPIVTPADPTGGSVSFSAVAITTDDPKPSPSTFTDGSWSGSWDSTTKKVLAQTPTTPASGTDLELSAGDYRLYVKWTVGSETPVKYVGVLRVV